ncbi:DUF4345 family protein [Pseudonocardia spinosispora]|uniref:DUF4345 family protein n=1 Tax=Pseudonocardia spinosispora TaxID=103441 RepID=UPI001FE0F634|nr:DUF4345 family protein [Pseudonocardia spinosispora]
MCAPTKALALFFEMRGPEGRNEVRAVYGGFGLAIAGLLALAAINVGELRPGAVFAVAAALAGMASGRLVARVFEPTSSFYPVWLYFWLEIVGASVLITAALTPK